MHAALELVLALFWSGLWHDQFIHLIGKFWCLLPAKVSKGDFAVAPLSNRFAGPSTPSHLIELPKCNTAWLSFPFCWRAGEDGLAHRSSVSSVSLRECLRRKEGKT